MLADVTLTEFGSGSDRSFATARAMLQSVGYTEERLCEQLGIESTRDLDKADRTKVTDLFVQIFYLGRAIPAMLLETSLPSATVEALYEISLIQDHEGRAYSPVRLSPVGDLYVASDRTVDLDETPIHSNPEHVFSGDNLNTLTFLPLIPREPKGIFLDMGTGCGVAALRAARSATSAWGTDISERCIRFAEFNRRLNGIENVKFATSDLFGSLEGQRFDCIVAHLPYEMSFRNQAVYADGGDDGEALVRRFITQLPPHANPGCETLLIFMTTDREDETVEQRIRRWLGNSSNDFDVVVLTTGALPVAPFAGTVIESYKDPKLLEQYMETFERLRVTQILYCAVMLKRLCAGETREPLTLRRLTQPDLSYEKLSWLHTWERDRPNFDFMSSYPALSPTMNLVTRHQWRDGELAPVEYRVTNTDPLDVDIPCPAWVAFLISLCNGERSGRELYETVKQRAFLSEGSFGEAIRSLGSAGVLRFDHSLAEPLEPEPAQQES
jgi:hypothetical protein